MHGCDAAEQLQSCAQASDKAAGTRLTCLSCHCAVLQGHSRQRDAGNGCHACRVTDSLMMCQLHRGCQQRRMGNKYQTCGFTNFPGAGLSHTCGCESTLRHVAANSQEQPCSLPQVLGFRLVSPLTDPTTIDPCPRSRHAVTSADMRM